MRIIPAPAVMPPLMEAQIKAANTSVLLSGLEARLSEMEVVLETLLNKTAFIKESSSDGITMINEAFTNGKYCYFLTEEYSRKPTNRSSQ